MEDAVSNGLKMSKSIGGGQGNAKDSWDKVQIISGVLGAIIIPIVVGVIGIIINNNIKNRDVQAKMIELSIQILRQTPVAGEIDSLRAWAIKTTSRYPEFGFDAELQKSLLTSRALPSDEPHAMWNVMDVCRNIPVVLVDSYHEYPDEPKSTKSDIIVVRRALANKPVMQPIEPDIYQHNESCYYLPDLDKKTREDLIALLNTTLEKEVSVSTPGGRTYRVQRLCDHFRFYARMPDYVDVWDKEQNTPTGVFCVVNFSPA